MHLRTAHYAMLSALLVATASLVGPQGATQPRNRAASRWVLPFTTTSASPVPYLSPDGKYAAVERMADGEVTNLTVCAKQAGTKRGWGRAASRQFASVNAAAWVPQHGHWLVVSTGCCDYGEGMIALWKGPGQTKLLRRAKSSEGEGFSITKVAMDGRSLVYQHFGDNAVDQDLDGKHRYSLSLPRR